MVLQMKDSPEENECFFMSRAGIKKTREVLTYDRAFKISLLQ